MAQHYPDPDKRKWYDFFHVKWRRTTTFTTETEITITSSLGDLFVKLLKAVTDALSEIRGLPGRRGGKE